MATQGAVIASLAAISKKSRTEARYVLFLLLSGNLLLGNFLLSRSFLLSYLLLCRGFLLGYLLLRRRFLLSYLLLRRCLLLSYLLLRRCFLLGNLLLSRCLLLGYLLFCRCLLLGYLLLSRCLLLGYLLFCRCLLLGRCLSGDFLLGDLLLGRSLLLSYLPFCGRFLLRRSLLGCLLLSCHPTHLLRCSLHIARVALLVCRSLLKLHKKKCGVNTLAGVFCFFFSHSVEPWRRMACRRKPWRRMVPEEGLEPPRCCHRQILSLLRLPFRHSGTSEVTQISYHGELCGAIPKRCISSGSTATPSDHQD